MTFQTDIRSVGALTVAVFVTAALKGAVVSYKTEVAPAISWRCTCSIDATLCTHRLTLTRETAWQKNRGKRLAQKLCYYTAQTAAPRITCWVCNPVCRCSDIPEAGHGSPECCCSGGGRLHIHPLLDSGGKTNWCFLVDTHLHSHLKAKNQLRLSCFKTYLQNVLFTNLSHKKWSLYNH